MSSVSSPVVDPVRLPATESRKEAARNRQQVARGERFDFGRNWTDFARTLDETRIVAAERSLQRMLGWRNLAGKTFLDVGSGSGLFSLAAMRLGAARVHSFDFDPLCVDCTRALRERFFAQSSRWSISSGDVLAADYMRALGTFDVVYSWGMLHQTGAMWLGMQRVLDATAPGGRLFLSIYNHQPFLTPFWRRVKQTYNRLPAPLGQLIVLSYVAVKTPLLAARGAVSGAGGTASPRSNRGMNVWHDAVDWIGGYPFETATPDDVFRFFRDHGLRLVEMTTVGGGSGCNEFVFERPVRGA